MRHKLIRGLVLSAFLSFILFFPITAKASLVFQTYINEGTASDMGQDMDTWFSWDSSFDLYVVGQYQGTISSIDHAWLVVSVPEGDKGTLTFTTGDEDPVLVTSDFDGIDSANENLLINDSNDGWDAKEDFLPSGVSFNEHYPFKDDVSDFLVYDLGSFDKVLADEPLQNYNADDGTITDLPKPGEQKEYEVTYTGFSKLHFDVIGRVTDKQGTGWEINPASHDSTAVPEPATMLLLGTGLIALAGLSRKKFFKK